jgi:hypothetical protein
MSAQRHSRLALERLEDRWVPSTARSVVVDGIEHLQISVSDGNTTSVVQTQPNVFKVTFEGSTKTKTFYLSPGAIIEVTGATTKATGTIDFNLDLGSYVFDGSLKIDTKASTDTINIAGLAGSSILLKTEINLGNGTNTFSDTDGVTYGSLSGAPGGSPPTFILTGGTGVDTFDLNSGSTYHATITGDDTLDLLTDVVIQGTVNGNTV